MVCMYFTTVCITVCIPVCTVCMRNCSEMLISCHAAVFSEFPALTASFLPESFSDLTMPVLHRPAAAPRGVRRRPAAASEKILNRSACGPATSSTSSRSTASEAGFRKESEHHIDHGPTSHKKQISGFFKSQRAILWARSALGFLFPGAPVPHTIPQHVPVR